MLFLRRQKGKITKAYVWDLVLEDPLLYGKKGPWGQVDAGRLCTLVAKTSWLFFF